MQLISSKKRKSYSEVENEYCDGDVELPENDEESSNVAEKNSKSPDLENVDLQSEGFETEMSTSINCYSSSSEATPTSEFRGDSKQGLMDSSSTSKKNSSSLPTRPWRKIPVEKMPSVEELEQFFAAAEKCKQKRFAEKYNYDIVKDVPLEGKFQWVRLHL